MGFSYSGKLFGGTGSGGVSVSGGVNTRVAYFTGASSLSSDSGLTYDAATDTLTSGRVLVGDGTAAQPSIGFASETNTGFFRSSGGTILYVSSGTNTLGFASGLQVLQPTGSIAFNGDAFLTRPAAATLQLGAAASATPIAQTLQAQGGSGTNISGANLTIQSGAGTGSATGSTIEFKTPTATGSGTTQQTRTTRLTVDSGSTRSNNNLHPAISDAYEMGFSGLQWQALTVSRATLGSKSKTLTDNVATAFATIPMADGVTTGGRLIYRCIVTSGTARQVVSGSINYAAVRDGASYVVDYDEVQQSTAVTSGTLTGSVTAAGASGLLTFSAQFDTDLGAPTITFYYRLDSTDVLAVTPL